MTVVDVLIGFVEVVVGIVDVVGGFIDVEEVVEGPDGVDVVEEAEVDVVDSVVVACVGMVEHLIQWDVSSSALQNLHFGLLQALHPRPP